MWWKIITLFFVLVSALVFTGCGSDTATQEIVDNVLQSQEEIRTLQFDMDMNVDMSGNASGEAFGATMSVNSKASIDIENTQMAMDMAVSVIPLDSETMEFSDEIYIVDGTVYIGVTEQPSIAPTWMKFSIQAGYFEQLSQIQSQLELLQTAAQVNFMGSEVLSDVDCYVLELTPDMDQLWQMVMQQIAELGELGEMPDVTASLSSDMFKSVFVKLWIAKDTKYLTKAQINMSIELTLAYMDIEEAISMTLSIHNYNEPVSIVLPSGAKGAALIPAQ